ncbi:MAG: hypothetical protein HC888_10585 [Candidatus Competibacteraceae bacterium]|nr:hypothetical protein [Candidatus Competibacteraceae bacterium]
MPKFRSSRFIEGRVFFDPETYGDTPNILHGPIVDQVTSNSAIISFVTDRPTNAAVTINNREITTNQETTHHELLVQGLLPETEYTYRVNAGGTPVRPYSSAPPAATPSSSPPWSTAAKASAVACRTATVLPRSRCIPSAAMPTFAAPT